MWFNILRPLIILITISTSIALFLSESFLSFVKVFLASCIFQVLVYDIYKKIVLFFAEKIKNDRIKIYSKQGLDVKCPCYLEKPMFVPIELNSENVVKCLECQKQISIEIIPKTFLKTEMINLDNADAAISEIYNKVK